MTVDRNISKKKKALWQSGRENKSFELAKESRRHVKAKAKELEERKNTICPPLGI